MWVGKQILAKNRIPRFAFLQLSRLLIVVRVSSYWNERALSLEEHDLRGVKIIEYIKICHLDFEEYATIGFIHILASEVDLPYSLNWFLSPAPRMKVPLNIRLEVSCGSSALPFLTQ